MICMITDELYKICSDYFDFDSQFTLCTKKNEENNDLITKCILQCNISHISHHFSLLKW